MFKSLRIVCLTLWAGHASLPAQTTNTNGVTNALPSRPISLQECLEVALEQNLDLRIERINPLLARSEVEQARAIYDPELLLDANRSYNETLGDFSTNGFRFRNGRGDSRDFFASVAGRGPLGLGYNLNGSLSDSWGSSYTDAGRVRSEGAGGSVGIDLVQPVLRNLWTDSERVAIALTRSQVKTSDEQLRVQLIRTITDVEKAYFELIFQRENVKVQEEGLRLAQRLYQDDLKRMQIGMIARLDEKQSESQVAARQADVTAGYQALSTAQNNLKRLIAANYRDLHGIFLEPIEKLTAVPQVIDLYESWATGLEERPDLRQGRQALERQGITLKFARNQRLPQLDISGSYGYNAGGTREIPGVFDEIRRRNRPYWSAGATFSVPLANKAARENYQQQRLVADQLLLELKKLEDTVLVEIDEAVNAVRTSLDRVQSTRESRAYAEEALTAEQQKLQSGKSTSFFVLELQQDLTAARSQEIRALADYNNALADFYQAQGTTLQRRKITLQLK